MRNLPLAIAYTGRDQHLPMLRGSEQQALFLLEFRKSEINDWLAFRIARNLLAPARLRNALLAEEAPQALHLSQGAAQEKAIAEGRKTAR